MLHKFSARQGCSVNCDYLPSCNTIVIELILHNHPEYKAEEKDNSDERDRNSAPRSFRDLSKYQFS